MPRRFLKHIFAILVLLIVAGCSGGGCSGCAGCGITPLPQGFPIEARVENAGSVRLTQSGLQFLSANLGTLVKAALGDMGQGGIITFPIDESPVDLTITQGTVCPGGPDPNGNPPKCMVEIDIGSADLDIQTIGPHNVLITGPLPIRLQNLPVDVGFLGDMTVVMNGNDTCPGENQTFANVDLDVNISVEIDANPAHSRHGYTRLKVGKVEIDQGQLESQTHFGCDGIIGAIINALKGVVFPLLVDPLIGNLQSTLDEQLCQQPNPAMSPPCPDGSAEDGGLCKYADGECVSIMLGTDGHINLSSFLASISPGTKGGLDILFAAGGENGNPAWGNLNPIDNGATIGMFGGALPKPQSSCVKLANVDPPQGVPIPDEILANTVSGWPGDLAGPHVGIALNERFFNYALAGMYDSGLLCIGIGGETLSFGAISFNSDLFGTFLGAKSVKNLGLQGEAQNLALVVRPGAPPTAVFGNGTNLESDPLIRIGVKQMSIDFYVWSLDRFIRFMTYTIDIDVPMNLTVTPDGLVPMVDKINLTNPTATNAALLTEDPNEIAKKLTDLIGSQIGTLLGGALPAINLNDQLGGLGITLNIPETVEGKGSAGLRKLTKDSDNYLGIFATLGLASAPPPPATETNASLVHKDVDPAGLALATSTPDNAPTVRIGLSSPQDDGTRAIEYQVRVDGGFWKPWTQKRYVDVTNGSFRVQGKHKVEVRSRQVGEPASLDATPAVVEFSVDAMAPSIRVKETDDGKAEIVVKDMVSDVESVVVRFRVDGGAWSEWLESSALPVLDVSRAAQVDVEAKDEEGLIGTAAQEIRGKAIPSADGGCGCTTAGHGESNGRNALGMLGLLVAGIALRLGKRRAAKRAETGKSKRTLRAMTSVALVVTAGSFAGCNCGEVETVSTSGGGCSTCDVLSPGLAGAYSSAVVAGDTLWVAGYVEKSISEQETPFEWGDLAVGRWNGTNVDWELVDGVPEQEVDPKSYDVSGYRGGVTDPGDDVGLWTSIAADDKGGIAVAYYDRTHRSLRFAKQAGDSWTVQTVQEKATSDIGRYAKLAWVNGAWNIAFLAVESGEAGAVTSGVRIASSATGDGWAFEDVFSNKATPCTAKYCASGNACVKETGLCTPELGKSSCEPACSSTQACVDSGGGAGACKDKRTPAELETYPEASGDYVAVAREKSGGLGVVFYDRVKGNLVMASKASGAWVTTILDGEANGVDTGDVGIGATLAIDDGGTWHVVYSNGYDESVQYLAVKDGVAGTPEVVDDGAGVEGTPFEDGRHIVGDDANVFVTAGGDIHVSYQDATAGTLHYAVGTASATGHTWAVKVVAQDGFAGAFSSIVQHQGALKVVNWYRKGGERYVGDVAIVAP